RHGLNENAKWDSSTATKTARFRLQNGGRSLARARMAGVYHARDIAVSLRGNSPREEWNPMGPLEREVTRKIPSGNLRCGLRISRLRQRRLDGYLPGKQRQVRF